MNFREFKSYISDFLDREKFEDMAREQIKESMQEIEEKKRPNETIIKTNIENAWNSLLKRQYDLVKDSLPKSKVNNYDEWIIKIDELELISKVNDSFSEI